MYVKIRVNLGYIKEVVILFGYWYFKMYMISVNILLIYKKWDLKGYNMR